MDVEDHVRSNISYCGVFVGCKVVQEGVDKFFSLFSDCAFLAVMLLRAKRVVMLTACV